MERFRYKSRFAAYNLSIQHAVCVNPGGFYSSDREGTVEELGEWSCRTSYSVFSRGCLPCRIQHLMCRFGGDDDGCILLQEELPL